ncbi:MAG: hypothetical protein J6I66_01980 [Lachnospiraceae bacterium]|nr:hypothetical protein [Lachnospiraceae bacterium]
MILSDKVYNVLKWVCIILAPALITFLTTVFTLLGIPHVEIVTGLIAAVATFIGALIGVSTKQYNKKEAADAESRN